MLGQPLGKDYRVLERIGVGGMGVVYLVEHASLRKRFAAKVLSKELAADTEARARFQTEAHAASQLEHENIVSLTDYGLTADARPYIVMEFLRGRTLDHRLDEGPLSLEEIVAVVIPVARALAVAHAEGIVHRDVKPENVFLTARSGGLWGVKVLDFGIAKTPVTGDRLTKTGQALGSPMYMAPEACRGDEIDHRADIYSLGVLMYLLWCGQVPFDDDNLLKVLQMQVSDPVPPPRQLRPDLSPALEAVILRALEKDPDRRFLSIAMLLTALEEALPPGADRLLIEAARGTTSMRALSEAGATPYPGHSTSVRTLGPAALAPIGSSPALATTLSTTPSPTTVRTWRRALMVAGGAALLVLAIVVYAVTRPGAGAGRSGATTAASDAPLTRSGATVAPGPGSVAALVPGPGSVAAAVPGPGSAAGPGSAPSDPVAPPVAVATVRVQIRTATPGARVTLGGAPLGTTPLDVEVPVSARSAQLRVELAGYRPWTHTLTLDAPVELEPRLATLGPVAPRPPRDRKPPAGSGSSAGSAAGSDRGSAGSDLGIRTSR